MIKVIFYYPNVGETGSEYLDPEIYEMSHEELLSLPQSTFDRVVVTQVVITTDIWSN